MNHRDALTLLKKWLKTLTLLGIKEIVCFSSIFFMLSLTNLYSQIISRNDSDYVGGSVPIECSTPTDPACIIILPPAVKGVDYSFTIPLLTESLRPSLSFIFTPVTNCQSGNWSNTPDGTIQMAAASICKPEIGNFVEIDLEVINNSTGDSDRQKYRLPILRDPVKIVMVLDISGSMSLPVPGGTEIRWQVLKNSVELFTEKLQISRQDKDSIGITYFSTNLTQPAAPINDGFISITTNTANPSTLDTIRKDLLLRGPTLCTAMGKGLLNAKLKLKDNTPINARKLVLLFTDGLQNVDPLVNSDGYTLSPGGFTLNNCPCPSSDSIIYYTIGMGDLTLVPAILAQIADANSGVALTTTTGVEEGDLYNFFQDQFSYMLEGNSPQIVSRKKGYIPSTGVSYTFQVNSNVSKIFFEFINPDARNITLKLEKDGKDLTPLAKISEGSYYKILSLPLPILSADAVPTRGEWKLTIAGTSTKKFSLACFVSDHFLDFQCKPSKTVYTVGDTLYFDAKIKYAGKTIVGNENKVQVMLLKPGDDLGQLLATYVDTRTDSVQDVGSEAQQKFFHLIQSDSSFYKALLPESQIITLLPDTAGRFAGKFVNTDLTGIYQLLYMVNGEIKGIGKFERNKQYTVVFKFGMLDPEASQVDATITNPPSSNSPTTANDTTRTRTATVTIKPQNKFGYYLGPGYISMIKCSISPKQGVLKSSKDNLDGSYTFVIKNIPPSIQPDLSITVMGELLLQGFPNKPPIHFWEYLILILLLVILLIRYIYLKSGMNWLKIVVWIFLILWIILLILQKLGIIHF